MGAERSEEGVSREDSSCFTESENLNEHFVSSGGKFHLCSLSPRFQVFSEFRRSLDSGWDTIVRQSHHRPEHLLTFPAGVPLPAA